MSRSYRLQELAEVCGVKPRTIRYYVQRGLLPAPTFRGPETAYDQDHLYRLQAIRHLQERFWSLDAIASHLATLEGPGLETWMTHLESGSDAQPDGGPVYPGFAAQGPALPEEPSLSALTLPPPSGGTPYIHYSLAPGLDLHFDPERASEAGRAFLEDVLDLARRYRLRSF